MCNKFRFIEKIFLVVFIFSSFIKSNSYPSHFFYYPEIYSIENQSYILTTYALNTTNLYPQLHIIRMPGVAIRYMRSKEALSYIPIRVLLRCPISFKYSSVVKELFSNATALQIALNQSWTTGWTTNNTFRKNISSSSGPCFETRVTTLSEISTNLKPLLEGLKVVSISAGEVTSTLATMDTNHNALPTQNGPAKIINLHISKWIPNVSSTDIGASGDLIYLKGMFSDVLTNTYTTGTKALTTADINTSINSWKNIPMEIFIVSSNELAPSDIIQNTNPIIKAHDPNPAHTIMFNYESPGMSNRIVAITQSASIPNGAIILFSTGELKPATLIALEILEQYFISITTPIASTEFNCSWQCIGQSGFFILYTAPNSSASGTVGGKTITRYMDETLMANFQNTVNLAYVKDRLCSSWSNCLGKAQKQGKSLDAVIRDNNNNIVDGFFTWMEEWYGKETEIDNLYKIGASITCNSDDFTDLCTEVVNVFTNIRTHQHQYKYSTYTWTSAI